MPCQTSRSASLDARRGSRHARDAQSLIAWMPDAMTGWRESEATVPV